MACEFPVAVRRVANCYTLFTLLYFYYPCTGVQTIEVSADLEEEEEGCRYAVGRQAAQVQGGR